MASGESDCKGPPACAGTRLGSDRGQWSRQSLSDRAWQSWRVSVRKSRRRRARLRWWRRGFRLCLCADARARTLGSRHRGERGPRPLVVLGRSASYSLFGPNFRASNSVWLRRVRNMKFSSHDHLQSRPVRARPGAVVLLLLVAALGAGGGVEKKHKVVEIKVREIDPAQAAKVSYARQIKPILVDNCLECHSTEDHKGGLDITSVANLIKGGKKASPAVLPGDPDKSALIEYLRGLREPQMPKGNPVLSE